MFKTISTLTVFGLLAMSAAQAQSNQPLRAQIPFAFEAQGGALEGVWDVSVTVTDCHGTTLRTVHSLQLFHPDGSVIETSNLGSRGISEGVWKRSMDRMYEATYWFFRYPPPLGPYASFATIKETITLDSDNDHFTSSGTVVDLEANGTTLTSCFTHTAQRLADLDAGRR